MTVWVVTLNGQVLGVAVDREQARVIVEEIKHLPKFAAEVWRPVGTDAWSSQGVTLLERRAWEVRDGNSL